MPPLNEIKIKDHDLIPIDKNFTDNMIDGFKKSSKNIVTDLINSKIFNYTNKIIYSIQNVVKKKTPILQTSNGEPFIENSCCNSLNNTIQYFIEQDKSIYENNILLKNYLAIINDIALLEKPSILYHNQNTKINIPKISNDYDEIIIYKSFIHFCNFNNNLPINHDLRSLANNKPTNINYNQKIELVIEDIKSQGKTFSRTNFYDLLDHNIIADPFYGTNEDSIQWVSKRDWEYLSNFSVPKNIFSKQNIMLSFHGLDTYAEVFLNDSLILIANNMFRTWEINVKGILKKENTLLIKFNAISKSENKQKISLGYNLPGGDRVFTRKAGFHYGWDWGAKISPTGIWRSVELKSWNSCRIKDVYIEQTNLTDSLADLKLNIELESSIEKTVNIKTYNNISKDFKLTKGNKVRIVIVFSGYCNQDIIFHGIGRNLSS